MSWRGLERLFLGLLQTNLDLAISYRGWGELWKFVAKQNTLYKSYELQAAMNANKNERGIWGGVGGGVEFGLIEMCFPSPGL